MVRMRRLSRKKIIIMIKLEMPTIAMNPFRNVHMYGKAMIWQKVLVTTEYLNAIYQQLFHRDIFYSLEYIDK